MPAVSLKEKNKPGFRPPQELLDIFWTLSDGNDKQRNEGAIKLAELVSEMKTDDKTHTLNYCKERLVRGMSSGRKFARVGFAVALTQLLKQFSEIETADVLQTVKEKLKLVRHEKKSKSEVGGIYLGRAFAYSTLIQSSRIGQLDSDALSSLMHELTKMAEKKSYLKPVCIKTIGDLVVQTSTDSFAEHIWPQLRDDMKKGWDSCTLDKLLLLIVCREKFPDVVNKKFLKKHWGFPLLSEDNDTKLIQAVFDTTVQKSELFLQKIIPRIVDSGRDVMSVWTGIGDKLMDRLSDKKAELQAQRHLLGLKLATHLLSLAADPEQGLSLLLAPKLAQAVFHTVTKKNDPLATAADLLCEQIGIKLKLHQVSISDVLKRIWELQTELPSDKVNLINTPNFMHIANLMTGQEAEEYTQVLVAMVNGTDKWKVLSDNEAAKRKQIEGCLRQLQHIVTSQHHTTPAMQKSVLALFLRLSFFKVNTKTKKIEHCQACVNFEESDITRKTCESFFYKCLDQLSTLSAGQQKKAAHLTGYLNLLTHLAEYVQTLMSTACITPIKSWPEQMKEEWEKLFSVITKLKKKKEGEPEMKDSAFLLLFAFLGFQMFTEFKTAVDLLQEIYVCYEKARKGQKAKHFEGESEIPWVEVVTEVLLNLMSLESHLGRVVTTLVFKSLSAHVTPAAIQLITEVLLPQKSNNDDAGGVMVEEDDGEDEDDENELLDEDVPDEESEEESDGSEEGDMDTEDENGESEEVDDKFRESVRKALGEASDDVNGEEEEDLPDLSDSEMFKLDDMLAEVFRQRKKAGGRKKAQKEKAKEVANFRMRVLDLVEVMIKGERCGDFVLDILKPLLLLLLKMNQTENQALSDRARALFQQLKSKVKGLLDSVHSPDDQRNLFQELLDLARTVTDSKHLQEVAVACHIVMNLNCSQSAESSVDECLAVLEATLRNVTAKKQSKPHLAFFSTLIELDPPRYQMMFPLLIDCLQDSSAKPHCKMMSCSLLSCLVKKGDNVKDADMKKLSKHMQEATPVISELLMGISKDELKVMLTKDVLTCVLALQTRRDVLKQPPFGKEVKEHLQAVKSKFNTDLRRLANKIVASIERDQPKKEKKKKKRKTSEGQEDSPPAKKQA